MLLVGETGTGKTTVCQMAAALRGQTLHILNCNQHTETSDFLGGFRPARCAAHASAWAAAHADRSFACGLGIKVPDRLSAFVELHSKDRALP